MDHKSRFEVTSSNNDPRKSKRNVREIRRSPKPSKLDPKTIAAGIHDNSFVPYYQPQLFFNSSRIKKMEVLTRYVDFDGTVMGPDAFIETVERSAILALPFLEEILRQSLQQCSKWLAAGLPMAISVNVCAADIEDPRLLRVIDTELSATKTPPSLLMLELTEREVLRDEASAHSLLAELKGLGVGIAIDDFLIDQNGVDQLDRFPMVDEIKLDFSMTRNIQNATKYAFVDHITRFAHDIGKEVVAEGVETRAEYDGLHSIGVDAIQGYMIGRAMVGEDVLPWLVDSPWKGPQDLSGAGAIVRPLRYSPPSWQHTRSS
jgi:EAL domain-containing protein (putative c-di-GMP-specific phosphodiesterase class I)